MRISNSTEILCADFLFDGSLACGCPGPSSQSVDYLNNRRGVIFTLMSRRGSVSRRGLFNVA